MGFSTPIDTWFRTELKDLTEANILGAQNGLKDIFDASRVQQVWDEHQSGKHQHGIVLWSMLMYQMWYNKYAA